MSRLPEVAPTLRDFTVKPSEPWDRLDDLLAEVDAAFAYDPNMPGQVSPGPIWLDACRLARWLRRRFSDAQLGQLNGQAGTVRRWRAGEVARVHLKTADKIVTDLGGHIGEIPASIWITRQGPLP